jgi:hypothetical protein
MIKAVVLRILGDDADAKRKVDSLLLRADEIEKKDPTLKVGADTTPARARLDELKARADEMKRGLTTLKISADNRDAMLKLKEVSYGADAVQRKLDMHLSVGGIDRADLQLSRLEIKADRLRKAYGSGGRSGLSRVGSALISLQALKGLFSGGSGGAAAGAASAAGAAGAEGAAAGGSGIADALLSPVGIGGMAAGAFPLSALIDALAGMGIGTGVAGAGAYGAYHYDPGAFAPGMGLLNTTFGNVFKSIAPSMGMIFADLGRFVSGNQNNIAKMFSAALPFASAFLRVMQAGATSILPAFTNIMRQMVSSGALKQMTQGFVFLAQGLGAFINDLGPGMRAGAEVFRAAALGIDGILRALGMTLGKLGQWAGDAFGGIRSAWDAFRHGIAGDFDSWRHGWASDWDYLWQGSLGTLIRFNAAASTDINNWLNNTIHWFSQLPGEVGHALSSFGSTLYSIGSSALHELWDGVTSAARPIISWFRGFANSVVSVFRHIWGWFSPSSLMYQAGRDLMLGLSHGIKDHAHLAITHAAMAAHGVAGAAGPAQAYAKRLAAAYGWSGQWSAINAVAMRESGWSMTARNPSSGAYGIAQFINGPSEYYQYGGNPNTLAGQVTAFYNYMRDRYGSPSGAWAHELQYGWYDRGGVLKPGLTLALNTTGHDEMISAATSAGSSGGHTHIYNISVNGDSNPDEAARRIHQQLRKYKNHMGGKPLGLD